MDSKTELIRQQMDETRTELADKLGQLEQTVTETVQGVTETVQDATAAVTETVGSVQEAVTETVQTVRETVEETVQTVKESFDVRRHVREHPWLMMAGAAGIGWIAGSLLLPSPSQAAESGDFSALDTGHRAYANSSAAPSMFHASGRPAEAQSESGFLGNLGNTLMQHLEPLKGLALGTVFGLVREAVEPALPQEWSQPIREMIDGITEELGGKPVQAQNENHSAEEAQAPSVAS